MMAYLTRYTKKLRAKFERNRRNEKKFNCNQHFSVYLSFRSGTWAVCTFIIMKTNERTSPDAESHTHLPNDNERWGYIVKCVFVCVPA